MALRASARPVREPRCQRHLLDGRPCHQRVRARPDRACITTQLTFQFILSYQPTSRCTTLCSCCCWESRIGQRSGTLHSSCQTWWSKCCLALRTLLYVRYLAALCSLTYGNVVVIMGGGRRALYRAVAMWHTVVAAAASTAVESHAACLAAATFLLHVACAGSTVPMVSARQQAVAPMLQREGCVGSTVPKPSAR